MNNNYFQKIVKTNLIKILLIYLYSIIKKLNIHTIEKIEKSNKFSLFSKTINDYKKNNNCFEQIDKIIHKINLIPGKFLKYK